ncbi:MAG: Tm-1-like ATP-binding domain-containing protein [Caldilineales bacterium]|nr:Tm-1-like ATP-binding domain-containing protein [Caldilineales bacterium]
MTKSIVLAGALDTKWADYAFVRDLIQARGLDTLLIDFGILGDPPFPADVTNAEVAKAGGSSIDELRRKADKTQSMRTMSAGLAVVLSRLFEQGRLDGVMAMGGGGGTSIACAGMRALPFGVPKLMVTTVGAGDVSQYVGTKDIVMMPAVVDVAGVNRISRRVYANAAGAMTGMVNMKATDSGMEKPVISASMFGNTTPCITHAQRLLEAQGYEVLVFHATGAGGRTMESLIADGFVAANLDLTTTELADEVCGGVFSAGPDRLLASARRGIPTVLSPGCVDMANFWAPDTLPAHYRQRKLYEWNPNVTLMRTNAEENRRIGGMIAAAANASTGPVAILLPLQGVSQLDSPGGAFWDPAADAACFDAIRHNIRPGIDLIEIDANINDPILAETAVELILAMIPAN